MTTPVIKSLTAVLANTYALAVKTHAAHWNVTGTGFFQLHDAFAAQYTALFEAADDLAERIRALKSKSPLGIKDLGKLTTVSDLSNEHDGVTLATLLRDDHRLASQGCEAARAIAEENGDEATVDMLIARIEEHDKTAWMLEAYCSK